MITRQGSAKPHDAAELMGQFRELLELISEWKTPEDGPERYREIRKELCDDPRVQPLLPLFVLECRTSGQFWDYIRNLQTYKERRAHIQGQLLPVERQLRPDQSKTAGLRPPELRVEYSPVRPIPMAVQFYVAESRLAELRTLKSAKFDFCKLIRLCEELNVAYSENCFYAVAMLTRSILDHVPPVFGVSSFAQVANNYAGAKSFKELMGQLEVVTRKVGDLHLHSQISRKEALPVEQQVSFKAQFDLLLAEVIRANETKQDTGMSVVSEEPAPKQRVPKNVPEPDVDIEILYRTSKKSSDVHEYQLEVRVINRESEPIESYYVEIEFPAEFIPPTVSFPNEVKERRTDKVRLFRVTRDDTRKILYPGDPICIYCLDYFVSELIYQKNNREFAQKMSVAFAPQGRQKKMVERPFKELQNFG